MYTINNLRDGRCFVLRLLCALILLSGSILAEAATKLPLSRRISVESRLSAYLNCDRALLVFERRDTNESIELTLSFIEQHKGIVPCDPFEIVLEGNAPRSEHGIDISTWPDGEYKMVITEKGSAETPLIRGIRKQSLSPPQPLHGVRQISEGTLFFIDDWHIESSSNLTRRVNPAEMLPVEPWSSEVAPTCVRNSIQDFSFDKNGDLHIRILASNASRTTATNYWVRSSDFQNWRRSSAPDSGCRAGIITLRGAGGGGRPTGKKSFRRYDPETDGPVDLTQVNVRWSGVQTNQFWGDTPIPYRSRIAVWEKPDDATLILGDPITVDRHLFADDEIGTWADSNDNFGGIHLSADGRRLDCYQSRIVPRHDPFRVYYDNLLADRIMVTWSTTDGLNWTPRFFDAPTLDDPWGTQHYGVDVWQAEKGDLILAYHRIYDVQQQKVCTELAFSRDGIYWQRAQAGRPFLTTGERGSFNYGYAITTGNNRRIAWKGHCYEVMQGINVLHFMFLAVSHVDNRSFVTPKFFKERFGGGRMTGEHGVENSPVMNDYESWEDICAVTKTQMFTPALMRYRVDGWVSALPEREQAEFTTRLLQARGGLQINARTAPDGFIRVELLDAHGNPVPRYSGENAAVFNGDDTAAALSWQKGRLTTVPEQPFKIRIELVKSEIFTISL